MTGWTLAPSLAVAGGSMSTSWSPPAGTAGGANLPRLRPPVPSVTKSSRSRTPNIHIRATDRSWHGPSRLSAPTIVSRKSSSRNCR